MRLAIFLGTASAIDSAVGTVASSDATIAAIVSKAAVPAQTQAPVSTADSGTAIAPVCLLSPIATAIT